MTGKNNYYIKKNFQGRFIPRFGALAAVWATIAALVFAYLTGKLADLRYSSHTDIASVNGVLMPMTIEAHILSLLIFSCLYTTIHFTFTPATATMKPS